MELVKSVESNLESVEVLTKEQADLRSAMQQQHEAAQAAGMSDVQEQLAQTKEELTKGIQLLEKASLLAEVTNQEQLTALKNELLQLQQEHVALGEALGVATQEDPKAVNADNLTAALESLENKMEAIRDTKLGNEELELKMKPLMVRCFSLTVLFTICYHQRCMEYMEYTIE